MNRRTAKSTAAAVLLMAVLLLPAAVGSTEPKGVHLSFSRLSEWQEKSFKGSTAYSLTQSDDRTVLHAEADGTASGLYQKISVHAAELPLLKWSWKIKNTIAAENPYRKDGDDFAARVYIVFPGRFFWQTRAIAYVWSDRLPAGTVVPSPFTGNVAVIAVESGNSHAGTWRHESRNYAEDFRAYFHTSPPDPTVVAVMTDGDNTGSKAVAWYGDISFVPDSAPGTGASAKEAGHRSK